MVVSGVLGTSGVSAPCPDVLGARMSLAPGCPAWCLSLVPAGVSFVPGCPWCPLLSLVPLVPCPWCLGVHGA